MPYMHAGYIISDKEASLSLECLVSLERAIGSALAASAGDQGACLKCSLESLRLCAVRHTHMQAATFSDASGAL